MAEGTQGSSDDWLLGLDKYSLSVFPDFEVLRRYNKSTHRVNLSLAFGVSRPMYDMSAALPPLWPLPDTPYYSPSPAERLL
jgi:hypothetical protein